MSSAMRSIPEKRRKRITRTAPWFTVLCRVYTMLKRLCDKGIFQNNSGNVVSVLSKQEWFTKQSEGFVEETFNGSLPQFLVAFTRRKKLSKQEIAEIQKIIDQNKNFKTLFR